MSSFDHALHRFAVGLAERLPASVRILAADDRAWSAGPDLDLGEVKLATTLATLDAVLHGGHGAEYLAETDRNVSLSLLRGSDGAARLLLVVVFDGRSSLGLVQLCMKRGWAETVTDLSALPALDRPALRSALRVDLTALH
ncbi:MAG: hypothetical protein AB7S26_09805 [Sandaracinaceae bacterium]